MTDDRFAEAVAEIVALEPSYAPDAYYFVSAALRQATERAKSDGGARHVSGGELLEAARDLAVSEFGPMASEVLRHWGVADAPDIGKIVFAMVRKGVFGAADDDSLDDFESVFDLHSELEAPFLPRNANKRGFSEKIVAIDDDRERTKTKSRRDGDIPS